MRLRMIYDETFQDYRKPAMLLAMCYCDWKCCNEQGISNTICHNNQTIGWGIKEFDNQEIIRRYMNNNLTKAIIFGGLEPILQFDELHSFIEEFRKVSNDDVVIYTGYYRNEISDKIELLSQYQNIIVKFGRFILNSEKIFDDVLGIYLNSNNQKAERIS